MRAAGYCSRTCKQKASWARNTDDINAKRRAKRVHDDEWRQRDLERKRLSREIGSAQVYGRTYLSRLRERAQAGEVHAADVLERRRLSSKEREQSRKRDWYAHNAKRRALRVGAGGTYTKADFVAQVERQHHRCYWCGKRLGLRVGTDYHADHVIPLALGGSNDKANIVAACVECNLHKGAKHPIEFAGQLC